MRSYDPDMDFWYVCTVTLPFEIWPWVKVMIHPWVMNNNCVKYPDRTRWQELIAQPRCEQTDSQTSPLKTLNKIQQNLTGSKIEMSSTKSVFFGPIRETRWLPWPLIGWDIFDFFSETAECNSTKLDRKQDLNVLNQFCVFRANQKNKMALSGWDIFHFSSETTEQNPTKLDRKQFNESWPEARSQHPLPRADRKTKIAVLSDPSTKVAHFFRCMICGPLGLLFMIFGWTLYIISAIYRNVFILQTSTHYLMHHSTCLLHFLNVGRDVKIPYLLLQMSI